MLEDDILLGIFNCYRLGDENGWNVRLGWCKLSHVCRRWRHLIHSSVFHLSMHILCTNGSPIVDTLDHLPPLPLLIDYLDRGDPTLTISSFPWDETRVVSGEDELGIYHALRLHDRVRHINLHVVSPSTLDKSLRLMDRPFPILEHLSLSLTGDVMTSLGDVMFTLPGAFLAPTLRHLDLLGIRLPKRLRLLSSTPSLVTLKLTNIQASGYFHPRLLVVRLESLPQLEELSIGFSIPTPRPSSERLLLGKQGTPVMLYNLKSLTFRGVSAYLERLISLIRAPVLRELDITLFNQLAFTLPHLSHFVNITEHITFPQIATINFFPGTSIILSHRVMGWGPAYQNQGFTLHVMCKPLDWQIDCATQICSAFTSTLAGIESLRVIINRQSYSFSETDEADDTIDSTSWLELLRLFVNVKELHFDHNFSVELSRALELDEIGSDPGLLPDLRELVSDYRGKHASSLFGSFIHARQVAGRPVSLRLLPLQPLFGPRSPRLPS